MTIVREKAVESPAGGPKPGLSNLSRSHTIVSEKLWDVKNKYNLNQFKLKDRFE